MLGVLMIFSFFSVYFRFFVWKVLVIGLALSLDLNIFLFRMLFFVVFFSVSVFFIRMSFSFCGFSSFFFRFRSIERK